MTILSFHDTHEIYRVLEGCEEADRRVVASASRAVYPGE